MNKVHNSAFFFSDAQDSDWESESKRRKVEQHGELDSELWYLIKDETEWRIFETYVQDCRININVRQVLNTGQNSL